MIDVARERRILQQVVAVAALVPVVAGAFGVLAGPAFTQAAASVAADSHYRYLSGLLLGIGLCFWWLIPTIERRTTPFRILTLIVFVGGLGRLVGLTILDDERTPAMLAALSMELAGTPALCLWQARIADRTARAG